MLKKKRLKKNTGERRQISNVALLACLLLGFTHAVHSAEIAGSPADGGHLRIAPIRFSSQSGGYVQYLWQRTAYNNIASTSQSISFSVYTGIQAYSYIWQPWFSQVSAGLSLGLGNSHSNSSASSSNKSSTIGLGSNASIKLLPKSRFPFEAKISRSRNLQRNGLNSNTSTDQFTIISLIQRFEPRSGVIAGGLTFNHDVSENFISAPSKSDSLSLDFIHTPALLHSISVRGSVRRNYRPAFNYRSLTDSFSLKHSFRPNQFFSTNSILDLNKSSYKQDKIANDLSSKQFNSVGSWRSTNDALNLTGSARFYSIGSSSNGKPSPQSSGTNLYFSTYYAFSQGVRATGSINVNDDIASGQSVSSNVSLTSTKSFTDITNISGWVYKRYISGSLSSQNRTVSNSSQFSSTSQNLGLSGGHSLTKGTFLFGGPLIANTNQSLGFSVSTDSSAAPNLPLGTNASLSWSLKGQNSLTQTETRLSISDSRNLGSNHSLGTTQLYNLQALRTQGLARHQSLNGNLTVQRTFRGSSLTSPSSSSFSTRASVNYIHSRVFNVPNLVFLSSFKIDHSNQARNFSNRSISWENNLDYFIGSLELKFRTSLEKIDNNNRYFMLFSAKRSF